MKTGVLILVLLKWSSAERGALADKPTPQQTLGEDIVNKQEDCERIIGVQIDEILDKDTFNIHDFPIPDDNYHECKKELNRMKWYYIKTYNIDTTLDTDFFSITRKDGSTMLITLPAQENAKIRQTDFDEIDELCVNYIKCSEILKQMEKETDREKVEYLVGRFGHCHILLDEIKQKYIKVKKLEEKKLKDEGGMSLTCGGQSLMMSLPQVMNSLGYHSMPNGVFGEAMKDQTEYQADEAATTVPITFIEPKQLEEEKEGGEEKEKEEENKEEANEKEEGKKQDTAEHNKEPHPEVKGTPSSAFVERANIVSGVLVVFVLVKIM